MRRGFTIDRFITSQRTQAGLAQSESPATVVRRSKFEQKTLFSIFFKSNGPILIHAVDNNETIDHDYYIENCLKPIVKEI